MDEHEPELLSRAVAADPAALERLLYLHYDRLAHQIHVPPDLQGVLSADDIVQETFVEVWSHIGTFRPQGKDSFQRWLSTIAKRKLLDQIKAADAQKRGGGRVALADDGSLDALLDQLAVDAHTPSRSARRHEREQAVRAAIEQLPEGERQAVQWRYLHGLSVAAVAARLGRTPHAVEALCHRAKQSLRARLGDADDYFSSRG